ncbi:MAG: hypothetical protein IMF19_14245 [Proteobacteria bacterium]|nr:hypothetical protein [Pseudomonadota bacterium]
MAVNKFEGQTPPFTQHGWTRQIKSGYFRNGATYKQVEKVKVLGRGTMGAKLEEVHILASFDIDQGGNKTTNKRKGQHVLSLKKGVIELAFAVFGKGEWRVLTYDCSYYLIVKTQKEAEKILTATNWRKWLKKGGKK